VGGGWYDKGSTLPPSATLIYNAATEPEPVLTADRLDNWPAILKEQPRANYRTGRKPNDPTRRRIRLTADLVPALNPPATVDWYTKVPASTWGMDGNDALGDCTCAEIDHAVKTLQVAAGNTEVKSTSGEVVKLYEQAAGYNPSDPNTDQGAEMQVIRDWWRKNGVVLGGTKHTILLFAEVDHTRHDLVKWCIAHFGELGVGFDFPDSAMTQFNQGKPWDVVKGAPAPTEGHAVAAVGYDDQYVYVVTWGRVQKMTWAFWDKYVAEAWTQLSSEFVGASGSDPLGETLYALGQQYAAITGQANPIPAPSPQPTPSPSPAPTPAPVGFPLAAVTPWLDHAYAYTHVEKTAKAAIKAWLASS
jgi:hypothetical protein